MFGRRKARDGKENGGAGKPLTLQERLNLLESGDVLLKYPAGLLQPCTGSGGGLAGGKEPTDEAIRAGDTGGRPESRLAAEVGDGG